MGPNQATAGHMPQLFTPAEIRPDAGEVIESPGSQPYSFTLFFSLQRLSPGQSSIHHDPSAGVTHG